MKSRAARPVLIGLATGIAVAVTMIFLAPRWLEGWLQGVASYDAAVAAMLIWYWSTVIWTKDAQTGMQAAADDPPRNEILTGTLLAVGFGLFAAFFILGHGPHNRGQPYEAVVLTIGFAAIVLGWVLIHTLYTFHYAHTYYWDRDRDKEIDRGLEFPGKDQPDYYDMAYFSFVIGMTFQVSDVQITSRSIRRTVLGHGIVAFVYNTAILALVINLASNFLH
jgi:uncharacterized membrane protein